MLELSLREARRLNIGAQLLAGPTPKRATKATMLDTIRHLGALQIDSISVVARSHHIVMWSRIGNHPVDWVYELLAERRLFEYWAHAAAYVPIEMFPYFRRVMLDHQHGADNTWGANTRAWAVENAALIEHVTEYIRQNGPVSTKSFDAPEGSLRATPWAWYGNKPTNRVLDYLWTTGVLMIDRREKFMRWYELTERVLPDWDDANVPSPEDERIMLGTIALRAMGLTSGRWLPDYFRKNWGQGSIPSSISRTILDQLVERGIGVRARVEGQTDEFVVAADLLERKIPVSRTTLLSPFDSLIWDRRRAMGLFDFYLQLEAYTPEHKRQYGYFSLPILYRDRLVGRVDPKADRKARQFRVKALHLEPWFVGKDDERFYASLAGTLRDFATFNVCDEIVVERGDLQPAAERMRNALLG